MQKLTETVLEKSDTGTFTLMEVTRIEKGGGGKSEPGFHAGDSYLMASPLKALADYALLSSALDQMGPWMGKNVQADRVGCLEQLQERIEAIDWKQAREDVRRFVKSNELPSLDLYNAEFFLAQATKLA